MEETEAAAQQVVVTTTGETSGMKSQLFSEAWLKSERRDIVYESVVKQIKTQNTTKVRFSSSGKYNETFFDCGVAQR
jgi:hypothetical protein